VLREGKTGASAATSLPAAPPVTLPAALPVTLPAGVGTPLTR
jgi:hypothetical protein